MRFKSERHKAVWNKLLDQSFEPISEKCDLPGTALLVVAEGWARRMDARIDAGAKLEDVAEEEWKGFAGTLGKAYMQVAATLLMNAWAHGKELQRLFENKKRSS